MDLLEPSDDDLALPVQGRRVVLLGADGAKDAFWVYEQPTEGREDIAGLLAPWPGRVDVIVD